MKIAIQGHPTRGKEVIQIFKSLNTEDILDHTGSNKDWYYIRDDSLCPKRLIITSADETFLKDYGYPVYTLEEFEKEFPFKIGDRVTLTSNIPYKIVALEYYVGRLCYRLDNGLYYDPEVLEPYKEMKERNITLTLEKAKEWYNNGGELKEVALQAFTEQELNPLPKSWEEYYQRYQVPSMIFGVNVPKKYVALWKLEQLRDCYRQGWIPQPHESIYAINYASRGLNIYIYCSQEFLAFQSIGVAEEFLKNFEPLIKEAGDLI